MAHQRKLLREHIRVLLTNATTAGQNVFSRRATALWKVPLPVILIYAREENSEEISAADILERKLQVAIEIRAEANDTLDDVLDDIAEVVEARMKQDRSLGNLALTNYLSKTEIDTGSDGEKDLGACRLTFEIVYDG